MRPRERHLDGFTSRNVAHVTVGPAVPVPTDLDELAAELVNAIFPGRREEHIDFAYVVEDLELFNQDHPERVIELFRNAVESYFLNTWPQQTADKYAQVRERCSFHLFRPMTEAYFFGEPGAVLRAGAVLPAQLPANLDLEHFHAADPVFLALPPRSDRIADTPSREAHPKSYLHYLCDPTLADRHRRYRETVGGVAALKALDWAQVVSVPPHCPFLHAFLDDLGAALDHPLPFINRDHADPQIRFPGPRDRILRNR